MLRDSTVIRLRQPDDAIDDPLTELAREGARRMLAQALVAEADAFVALSAFAQGWAGVRRRSGQIRCWLSSHRTSRPPRAVGGQWRSHFVRPARIDCNSLRRFAPDLG
jgi:hypothetical protein